MDTATADLASWVESGAMALTGPAEGPPCAGPAGLAGAMTTAAADLATQTARWGSRVEVDGPALLGERAAITAMSRRGEVSVGGAARFTQSVDGWVVLNLPRPDDVASLPALVGEAVAADDWPAVASALAAMTGAEIVTQATLLGLAAAIPHRPPPPIEPGREIRRGGPRVPSRRPLVVDLSSLWAGPLAASLLGAAGARVIKIEGRARPDGARRGATAFFDLMNHGKECISIDFERRDDRRFLRTLLGAADLVVEASRPRVMDHLGIVPESLAAAGTSWLSLTGHGRVGPAADRIGFGDDTAVAGGLYVNAPGTAPMFVADAVADPIAGLAAAALGADLLSADRAAVVEVPLVRAAAWASSPPVEASIVGDEGRWFVDIDGERVPVGDPRHRVTRSGAAAHGHHDASIRAEFAGLNQPLASDHD